MWRHPSRAVPVKRKRRGDEDDADGPLLDLEATALFTGLLEVRSRLLAVSVLWQAFHLVSHHSCSLASLLFPS